MKLFKKIGVGFIFVFIIAQFFSPEKNTNNLEDISAFITETNPPKVVRVILENTCYDCHSSNTTYPWYNKITPVNYWLASHVNDGKKHLNFSKWDSYSFGKKDHKLDELIEEVEEKEMPLKSYTFTHSDAKLSDAQISAITEWAKNVRALYTLRKKTNLQY